MKEAAKLASGKITRRNQSGKQHKNKKENEKKQLRNPSCWWDEDCRVAIDNRRYKQRKLRKEMTMTSLI